MRSGTLRLYYTSKQTGGGTNPETHWGKPGTPPAPLTARFQVLPQTPTPASPKNNDGPRRTDHRGRCQVRQFPAAAMTQERPVGPRTAVDGTFIWTASHDQRQCSLSTVSFAAAIVVGPEPRSSWSAHSEARTKDLDGGENVGDQLDLPAGGCEDGAVAITEGDRTPRVAAPSCRAEYLRLEVAPPPGRICTQMIQFWRRLSDPMTHHQLSRITVDRSFVREPSYPVLTSFDAALREDLGAYRAWSSAQSQIGGPWRRGPAGPSREGNLPGLGP